MLFSKKFCSDLTEICLPTFIVIVIRNKIELKFEFHDKEVDDT